MFYPLFARAPAERVPKNTCESLNQQRLEHPTVSSWSKNLDLRGFDSSRLLIRGLEFLGPWGDFPEI